MKKIILLAAIMFATIGVAYATPEKINDKEKISKVITDYFPALKESYDNGTLYIDTLDEETLADGSTQYHIRYKFVKSEPKREWNRFPFPRHHRPFRGQNR